MRIDNTLPPFYTQEPPPTPDRVQLQRSEIPLRIPQTSAMERYSLPAASQQTGGLSRPGIVVDISPEGWAAYAAADASAKATAFAGSKAAAGAGAARSIAAMDLGCETCKNRTYKDVSDDPSVSFQTPTHISPGQAASMVMAHESEHVSHEQAKADREGREVISQSVTLETSICPECGRVYVSGGVTRTVTAEDNHNNSEAALIER